MSKYYPWLILVLLISFWNCSAPLMVYNDKGPSWDSNEFNVKLSNDSVNIISYNIEHGNNINEAIEGLKPYIKDNSVLFLQEVDEVACQLISEFYNLNYIYYPIVFDSKTKKNFGNAILTKTRIINHDKIILPHEGTRGRKRHAVHAQITFQNSEMHLINVHLETIKMPRSKRLDQVSSICNYITDAIPQEEMVVLAGDFNTLSAAYQKNVDQIILESNLQKASSKFLFTSTHLRGLIKPSIDHCYLRNCDLHSSKVLANVCASDHFPIYIKIGLK